MLIGMGAAALVVESAEAARERGLRPICELLGAVTANSAHHGTRLDVGHISAVMEQLVAGVEQRTGLRRQDIAGQALFMSHETYTPARGGSASAEVFALRHVFGELADRIVMANTKGFTGHPMGVGIEDVIAVKALETGLVPPVANFKEVDPELGALHLSKGGSYPVQFALRLAAGFGSQISLSLLRWVVPADGRRRRPEELGFEYRVSDHSAWERFLGRISGHARPELEVVTRTLRVKNQGPPAKVVEAPASPAPPTAIEAPRPAPPAPVAAGPVAPAAAPPALVDPVQERILAIVAQKTGYPPDMLGLDLDLEADLGVDTVKQAELFTAVREEWGIPRDENRKLRDYPTLAHVIGFVHELRPDLAPQGARAAAAPAPAPAEATGAAPGPTIDVPRRVPVPVLRPALEACLETGVRLEPGTRVIVMTDRGGVAEALAARLQAAGVAPLGLNPVLSADDLRERLDALLAEGPISGVYWLPALDDEGDFLALDLGAWREALRVRVKLLYATMRALYESVAAPGTFLVSATRLGGRHGYDQPGATAPLGGAVSGFTKAYKRERPEALVKVVDFAPQAAPDEVAGLLLAETLRDPGAVEIGHADGLRTSVTLVEQGRAAEGPGGVGFGHDTVVVVTGAAGSIVSAITVDLAAHSGGTFHLFDLVPEPDRGNADLARLRNDREGLKRELFERLKARGERATPALVERELMGLERGAAALAAIQAIEGAGGRVHYYSVDLRDGAAVAQACGQVRERSARVDLLLHGAGLEISRLLSDKEPREFDLVFDVKCDGWFNVLKGLGDVTPAASVAFSSIAGRFGNGGQTDYSAANDLLCKTSSALRRLRPGMRPLAVDWTAWGDIGMATRGSIPKMMELAGIDMLPAAIGIPIARLEAAAGSSGELLVAGRLGLLQDEWHPSGGLDLARCEPRLPELGAVTAFSLQRGLQVETRLDPQQQPFLRDHQIEGTPVLPGVMGIETFARVASAALPGWRVAAVEGMEFLAPLKFYRNEPRTLKVEALLRPEGDRVVAECRLLGERALPGQATPQVTTHFRGRVVLQRGGEAGSEARLPLRPVAPPLVAGRPEIYRVYFHGPAYQVLQGAWRQEGLVVGAFAVDLPADRVPSGEALMEPRLVELCFQTAGLMEMGQRGQLGLPRQVGRVRRLRAAPGSGALFAVVGSREQGFEARVVDAEGRVYLEVEDYRTIGLPAPLDADGLRALQSALC